MKIKIFFVLFIVLIMSLVPAAIRTYNSSLHAYDLIILATTPDSKLSMNPYDGNGLLINQNIAVSILKNFQYPYQHCVDHIHGCDISLISWAGRSLRPDNVIESKTGLELIRFFVEKGEPLEETNAGLPLVHEAILFNNPDYLELLLSLGANIHAIARHQGKSYHELNPEAFLKFLESKGIVDYSEVRTVLEHYLSGTPPSIVGLWQGTEKNETVEFKANGHVIIVDNMSATVLGRYKIKDDNLIKIELFADNILRDSVQPSLKTEMTAEISKLNSDSMQLRFNEAGETEDYKRIR